MRKWAWTVLAAMGILAFTLAGCAPAADGQAVDGGQEKESVEQTEEETAEPEQASAASEGTVDVSEIIRLDAVDAFAAGNEEQGIIYLTTAATMGNPEAAGQLGELY